MMGAPFGAAPFSAAATSSSVYEQTSILPAAFRTVVFGTMRSAARTSSAPQYRLAKYGLRERRHPFPEVSPVESRRTRSGDHPKTHASQYRKTAGIGVFGSCCFTKQHDRSTDRGKNRKQQIALAHRVPRLQFHSVRQLRLF